MHECNQAISGWKEYHMSENTISLYVYKGGQGEITEKKSRFIATVRPVESEDEAVSFINETKKKYWDARHNCSAFVIGKRQELTRCSDDGEPAGTAGRPMLDVLLKENILRTVTPIMSVTPILWSRQVCLTCFQITS